MTKDETQNPEDNQPIFCFGSNLRGAHGKGAALTARMEYGAVYGVGVGRTGNSYAIPTKDWGLHTLPLSTIETYVKEFIAYAKEHPELTFSITKVGCGLAKVEPSSMALLFKDAPDNCSFDEEWRPYLGDSKNYWGAFG